mgnify:CR=1 FL=1
MILARAWEPSLFSASSLCRTFPTVGKISSSTNFSYCEHTASFQVGSGYLTTASFKRKNAAATNLTDWSQFNSTLFSFHSAGWSARSPRDFVDCQNEPHGAASSQIICKSLSRGHCGAPQHPAVLPTSVLAAMARTGLQSARPTHPPSPARLRSVLPIHRLLGPAANHVGCRLAPPLSFHSFFFVCDKPYLQLFRPAPAGSRTKCCYGSSSHVIKIYCSCCYFSLFVNIFGGFRDGTSDLLGVPFY